MRKLSKKERFLIRYECAKNGIYGTSSKSKHLRTNFCAAGVWYGLIGWHVQKVKKAKAKERERQLKEAHNEYLLRSTSGQVLKEAILNNDYKINKKRRSS